MMVTMMYMAECFGKTCPTLTTRFIYTSTGRYTHPEQDRGVPCVKGQHFNRFLTIINFTQPIKEQLLR